jgi:uncharacterized protein HemY
MELKDYTKAEEYIQKALKIYGELNSFDMFGKIFIQLEKIQKQKN